MLINTNMTAISFATAPMRTNFTKKLMGDGDLAAEVAGHVFLDHAGGVLHAEEEHQLGDGGLAGDVIAADDTGVEQCFACLVEGAVHTAVDALGHVDDDHAAVDSLLDALNEPGITRGVAGAVGLEHDALDARGVQQVVERLFGDAGVEFQEHDIAVHIGAHLQGPGRHLPEVGRVVLDVKADFGQFWIVETLEGVEVVGAHLGGTVASPQVVLEEDGDLLHARAALLVDGSSHLQGGNEVLLAVGAHLADGQLRAGDDDGLA